MNTASRILGTVDAVPCTAHNASSCGRGIAMTRIEVRTPNLKSISVGKLQAQYSVDGTRILRYFIDFWHNDLKLHRSEEHTSELQSLMRISYAVFCLKKYKTTK